MERAFAENWRDELLARAWSRLAEWERETGQPYHAVLRFRADWPNTRSPELAAQLTVQLGKPLNAAGVRQLLHRAREKFAELLLDDVAQSLTSPSTEALADELNEIGLLAYCRPALDRRTHESS
jgi:RNA polymerase sigma-70 factor (ECF subfamily)